MDPAPVSHDELGTHAIDAEEAGMQHVTQAGAWCNGEVASLAWDMSQPLPDCLGFMVTRVHETGADAGPNKCRTRTDLTRLILEKV